VVLTKLAGGRAAGFPASFAPASPSAECPSGAREISSRRLPLERSPSSVSAALPIANWNRGERLRPRHRSFYRAICSSPFKIEQDHRTRMLRPSTDVHSSSTTFVSQARAFSRIEQRLASLRRQRTAFSRVCHSEHGYGGYYRSIDVTYSSAGWTTDDESKHPLFTRSYRRDGCLITLVSFISTSIPLQFIETSFDLRPCRFLPENFLPSLRVFKANRQSLRE